jgi:hypothetical protein
MPSNVLLFKRNASVMMLGTVLPSPADVEFNPDDKG